MRGGEEEDGTARRGEWVGGWRGADVEGKEQQAPWALPPPERAQARTRARTLRPHGRVLQALVRAAGGQHVVHDRGDGCAPLVTRTLADTAERGRAPECALMHTRTHARAHAPCDPTGASCRHVVATPWCTRPVGMTSRTTEAVMWAWRGWAAGEEEME